MGYKMEHFDQVSTKCTFLSTFQISLQCFAKGKQNIEFVQGVNFEFIDFLKNDGTKCLLVFDDSCEEIWNSKAFFDIATAGRHRGLSTIYLKHNFFHHSKLGKDVEL